MLEPVQEETAQAWVKREQSERLLGSINLMEGKKTFVIVKLPKQVSAERVWERETNERGIKIVVHEVEIKNQTVKSSLPEANKKPTGR